MIFNRRRHSRKKIEKFCTVSSPSGDWTCIGKMLNVSELGIQIELDERPEVKSELMVHVDEGNECESIKKAIVIWMIKKPSPEVGSTVGLEFI